MNNEIDNHLYLISTVASCVVCLLIEILKLIISLFKNFLFAYGSEKGKNLATKEDIEMITEKIESVKTKILEYSHISKFRYEKEYSLLVQISEKIFTCQNSFETLIVTYDKNVLDTQEMRDFYNTWRDLYHFCNCVRPFFVSEIYDKIIDFENLCWGGSGHHLIINHALNSNSSLDLQNQMKKLIEIKSQVKLSLEGLSDSIRKRIQDWEK